MQSNLLFGGADLDAVVRTVRDNDIDVLTLDELTPEAFRGVQSAGLLDELPYYYVETASGGAGGGIFSRYELTGAENLTGFLNRNVRVTMIHPELGPVTVFQFHPMPPNLDFDAWRRELRTIRDLLDQTPGKVIVGGDFNATYDHAPFRDLLRGRYADSAELLGVGALPTWPDGDSMGSLTEAGPFIGIDRVLVAGGHATDIHTVTIPGTDHRAVVARLRL
ncbi:endonuclease/exonuclease/phosphatase family protein [Nocardia crassostreae]|uniref:endonuclease/exonuclease/phosphatase family protein n=1 Tax=Nocardia crassostreae TaxID=53428 RepID=UPI001FE12173|nr:endonuclease/exonuclease/phosphatase family protein [Nocardia crassostreae]